MGWILGYVGPTLPPEAEVRMHQLATDHRYHVERDGHVVWAGGISTTCRFLSIPGDAYDGALVIGLGFEKKERKTRPLDEASWEHRLSQPSPSLHDLDGHFVAVRWSAVRWEAWTDVFGVRTLYVTPWHDGIAYSTRLDWLCRCCGRSEIDLSAFGGHWLTFNQMTTDALVQQVDRVGPSGRATWDSHTGYQVSHRPWTPPAGETGLHFESALRAFMRPALPEGATLSLGLSGGLDSRLLLSLLPETTAVQVHTFGDPAHPDVRLARRIAADLNVSFRHLHAPVPDADVCLELLREHVAQTQVVSPASSVLGLRYYEMLEDANCWVIDGGFGEVARRQFMNRLLRRGHKALRRLNVDGVLPHLRVNRADVFSDDVVQHMLAGARQQLERQWATMPLPEEIGLENHVDLLGVRARLPNFFGYEQNRLDSLATCYMPLAQPSVVRSVFSLPMRDRKAGRLVRQLIHQHRPALTQYPLVKGSATYPFRFTPEWAYLWTKAKSLFGSSYVDTKQRAFLDRLRPFALDVLASTEVRNCSLYDRDKLEGLVNGYYLYEQQKLAGEVDWWLAFECWRTALIAR